MNITAIIAILSCPIITPKYDSYPPEPITQALRMGTHVKAASLTPDKHGRVIVEIEVGGKKESFSIPNSCLATERDFKPVKKLSRIFSKYHFCIGDYCPIFTFNKNGSVMGTYRLCNDGNCEPGKKYIVKEDCPGGSIKGSVCTQPYELFQAKDIYALKQKNSKTGTSVYFTLNHTGNPVPLWPEP